MNKKAIFSVFVLLAICISSVAIYISLTNHNDIPQVDATVTLNNITTEEYASIAADDKAQKENIKKIYVKINISNAKTCNKREIIIQDLNVIDHYDKVRSYRMGDSAINNLHKEDTAESSKYIIFDSTGLTDDDIRNIYSDENINVSIITKENKKISHDYNIGKLLK